MVIRFYAILPIMHNQQRLTVSSYSLTYLLEYLACHSLATEQQTLPKVYGHFY